MSKKSPVNSGVRIRGMFHIQIEDGPTGRIVGDSGWNHNKITNNGYTNIAKLVGQIAGSSIVSALALGTGGDALAGDTVQAGEVLATGANSVIRPSATAATTTSGASTAIRYTATFSSANSFASASYNISNIGLWTTTGPVSTSGTFLAGKAYTSSALATNQNVNATYDIIFG